MYRLGYILSTPMALARRAFMQRSAAFIGLSSGLAACEQDDALTQELKRLLEGAPMVREAALAYMSANPLDQDFEALKQNLAWAQQSSDRQALIDELHRRRRADIAAGDVYLLEGGWFL